MTYETTNKSNPGRIRTVHEELLSRGYNENSIYVTERNDGILAVTGVEPVTTEFVAHVEEHPYNDIINEMRQGSHDVIYKDIVNVTYREEYRVEDSTMTCVGTEVLEGWDPQISWQCKTCDLFIGPLEREFLDRDRALSHTRLMNAVFHDPDALVNGDDNTIIARGDVG